MNRSFFKITVALLFLTFSSCKNSNHGSHAISIAKGNEARYQPKEYVQLQHPEWSKNATIYEVNIRQYTPLAVML